MEKTIEISLRPYTGRLFFARTARLYEQAHKDLFLEPDIINCTQTGGRFNGGCGKDGMWTYLIWAEKTHFIVHELSHVVLHVFDRSGINPVKAKGEPFCYYLSQLVEDVLAHMGKKKK